MRGWSRTIPALVERLMPDGYRATPEQAVLFTVEAWDVNCPQHIPRKLDAPEVEDALGRLRERVAALEEENVRLRGRGRPGREK